MKLSGSQAIKEILCQEGVEFVFGIPGATEVLFMDALEDCPHIKYILALHEVVAAGMAEGYARTSGKFGVLNLHTGTGLSAALPMLSNAFTGGVPLIITAGQQDTRLRAYEPHLTADLVAMAKPVTKWATEINHVEDIPTVFRRAFKIASHAPTGPVFVSLPQNIMAEYFDFDYVKGASYVNRLHPDPESVDIATDLLSQAQNPAIIVQDGVAKSGALAEIVELAEIIGARVYQPWMGDVNFPVDHSLYLGDLDLNSLRTRDMLARVDVLIAVGVALFAQVVHLADQLLTSGTKIIQVDDNSWEIGKNYPVAAGIEGDIKTSIIDLLTSLRSKMSKKAVGAATVRTETIAKEKRQADMVFTEAAFKDKDNLPISPYRLMREIKDNLRPHSRIVDDCWSYSAILRRTLGFSEAKSYQRARSGGSIGWGLPGSLGVKLGSPEAPVVCISGDGSAMWSIQSLWTAAHDNIPVTFIVCANDSYQQVRIMKTLLLGDRATNRNLGTDLSRPENDFCKIAEGMGVQARRVVSPGQLGESLREAFNLDKPNLVEVRMAA
jgi:benzoylformate decarboxylase